MTAPIVEAIIIDIAELDNPSFPDWDEAMVVTGDELRVILDRHLAYATQRAEAAERDRVRLDWLADEMNKEQAELQAHGFVAGHSLFRRNIPITRDSIDAAIAASDGGA